jgi:hypothetical protein
MVIRTERNPAAKRHSLPHTARRRKEESLEEVHELAPLDNSYLFCTGASALVMLTPLNPPSLDSDYGRAAAPQRYGGLLVGLQHPCHPEFWAQRHHQSPQWKR